MTRFFRTCALLGLMAIGLATAGCGGGGGGGAIGGGTSTSTACAATGEATPLATITAPSLVTGGQAGYAARVPYQAGCAYAWSISNGTILLGDNSDSIAFRPGTSGNVSLTCVVTGPSRASATGTATCGILAATAPQYNLEQALSDRAQSTTIAFSGFGMMTGNLGSQSFFPPGKVADYWGFQALRDNDPDNSGHNTSFLTRVSCNVLSILNDAQLAKLKALASSQVASTRQYAWKRYPLMAAFRRLMSLDLPAGTTGLSLTAVKAASRELYLLDGQISYERAVVYAEILRSFDADQKAYLAQMVGQGFNSWPDVAEDDVRDKTQGLSGDEVVALMTYTGDMYSWYTGSLTSDVYFCPERHGTYFGSFYLKDAPAVGHPGYSIDETMTGVVGSALCDSGQGFISAAGAARMNALVELQRQNLAGATGSSIVIARTRISEALRSLITSSAPSASELAQVRATVDSWSALYGELDGENVYNYITTFYQLYQNVGGAYIDGTQKTALAALRTKYLTVTYPDGTTVDYSNCGRFYLFAAEVLATSPEFATWTSDAATDAFFTGP